MEMFQLFIGQRKRPQLQRQILHYRSRKFLKEENYSEVSSRKTIARILKHIHNKKWPEQKVTESITTEIGKN